MRGVLFENDRDKNAGVPRGTFIDNVAMCFFTNEYVLFATFPPEIMSIVQWGFTSPWDRYVFVFAPIMN